MGLVYTLQPWDWYQMEPNHPGTQNTWYHVCDKQITIPYHPWDKRYIYLHLSKKSSIDVGKYTVPMNPMGIIPKPDFFRALLVDSLAKLTTIMV